MISHVQEEVVEEIISKLQARFGKEAPLTVNRGKVHEYLGMTIDFSEDGKVMFKMQDYVQNMIDEAPEELMKGMASSPAANYLFETNPDAEKLGDVASETYHHLVAKLLYLAKRSQPDVPIPVNLGARISKIWDHWEGVIYRRLPFQMTSTSGN